MNATKDEKQNDSLNGLKTVSNWRELVSSTGSQPWGRWNHQYQAFLFAQRYLENENVDRSKAALIRMPTGTGKTGVMALIANFSHIKGHILIVVPSSLLTYQIAEALNRKFWLTVKSKPKHDIRPAKVFFPTTLNDVLTELNDVSPENQETQAVLICTNQSLAKLYKPVSQDNLLYNDGRETNYGRLRESIGMVIVDEGHREPAKEWSRAIRWLAKPTILFSATPYRNDLRMFRVGQGKEYRFVYKFQEAVKAGIVREIAFVPELPGYEDQPEKFAAELHNFYYGKFQKLIPDDVKTPKVIVRCDNTNAMEKVTKELRRLENQRHQKRIGAERVIAIHDLYAQPSFRMPGYYEDSPSSEKISSKAIFWVHQNKLAEGLDDPDYCLVAFYQPFGNARSLVQQVGRIIRNPSGTRHAKAWVISDPGFELEKQWEGYLSYERYEKNIIGSEDIILAFRESLPKWFYYSKDFRVCSDFTDVDLVLKDVRLKPSVRIYVPPYKVNEDVLRILSCRISDELEEQNMLEAFSHTWVSEGRDATINSLLVHWQIEQTPYLERTGFFETSLFPTYLCYRDPYIFYHGCASLTALDEQHTYHPAAQKELEHLIPEKTANTLKQISLTNTDLGNEMIRKRSIAGLSLDKVGQMLNDHFHVINSVLATRNKVPIYLGFSRGTVSEPTRDMLSIEEYQKWTDTLKSGLQNQKINVNRGIKRYARPIPAPKTAIARYLLLDLTEFLQEYEPSYMAHGIYREKFTSKACDVKPDGSFKIEVCGASIAGKLEYSNKRFHLSFTEPIKRFSAIDSKNKSRPESFLSQGASIQVVTEDGFVYSDGQFFDPQNLWGKNRVSDLDVFEHSRFLDHITKGEKGLKNNNGMIVLENGTWANGSIFYGMKEDRFYKDLGFNPDIVICEDLGDERADFIAVDLNARRIAQIHCKNGGTSMGELSAGKLHEVVSQVQKNLGFFEPSERIDTNLADRWNGKWDDRVKRLCKTPPGWSTDKTIEEIRSLLRSNNIQKEVWVVMGNAYAPTKLPNAIKGNKKPRQSIIQMLYLLHACVSSVQMVGAQLKVITGTIKGSGTPAKPKVTQMELEAAALN